LLHAARGQLNDVFVASYAGYELVSKGTIHHRQSLLFVALLPLNFKLDIIHVCTGSVFSRMEMLGGESEQVFHEGQIMMRNR
jgi:hypothetical protein